MKPQFIIFVETITGDIIEAFTWCKDKESGIARAKRDAKDFGVNVVNVWAQHIKNEGV